MPATNNLAGSGLWYNPATGQIERVPAGTQPAATGQQPNPDFNKAGFRTSPGLFAPTTGKFNDGKAKRSKVLEVIAESSVAAKVSRKRDDDRDSDTQSDFDPRVEKFSGVGNLKLGVAGQALSALGLPIGGVLGIGGGLLSAFANVAGPYGVVGGSSTPKPGSDEFSNVVNLGRAATIRNDKAVQKAKDDRDAQAAREAAVRARNTGPGSLTEAQVRAKQDRDDNRDRDSDPGRSQSSRDRGAGHGPGGF